MSTREQQLHAKVKAVNKANKRANELFAELTAIFAPLVGQQLKKASGDLLAKVEKLLPKMENTVGLMIYRLDSRYTLGWVVKVCEQVDERTCLYHETTCRVGEVSDGVLKQVYGLGDPSKVENELRTDFTFEEVNQMQQDVKLAKRNYETLKEGLYPFGEEGTRY